MSLRSPVVMETGLPKKRCQDPDVLTKHTNW